MPFDVKCSNIVRFDKEAGKYVQCGEVVTAQDDQRGQTVECPKCGASLDLLPPAPTPLTDEKDEYDNLFAASFTDQPSATKEAAPPVEPKTEETEPDLTLEPIPDEAQNRCASCGALLNADARRCDLCGFEVGGAVAAVSEETVPEVDDEPEEHPAFRRGAFCPECGTQLAAGVVHCQACGYHQEAKRRLVPLEPLHEAGDPVGFERWFSGLFADSKSVKPMMIGLLIALAVLFLFITPPIGYVLIRAIGIWSALVLCPMTFVILISLLALMLIIGSGSAKGSAVKRTSISHMSWTLLLRLARMTGWRKMTAGFARRRILDMRKKPVADDDLLELQDLTECEVLDLEGTQVTDKGLIYLRNLPKLGFVILRRTGVTDAGVHDLQQCLPAAWIWH